MLVKCSHGVLSGLQSQLYPRILCKHCWGHVQIHFKYYCRVSLLCFVFCQLMENKGTKIMMRGIKNILALKRGFRRSLWTDTEI